MAEEIIGRIFSREEADMSFGPVLFSNEINSSELASLCNQADKYIMFNLTEGKLSILKETRVLLYPVGFNIDVNAKYAVYSKSKVEELLSSGKAEIVTVERRKDVISITNGQYTLEVSDWCPPICN